MEEKIKRMERENEEDRSRLLSTNQNLDQRVRRLQRETEESQHERFQLLETVNQYKTDNQVDMLCCHICSKLKILSKLYLIG